MYINEYHYKIATIDCGDHLEIEGLDRSSFATNQLIELIPQIVLTRPTAVLYCAGAVVNQSESRDPSTTNSRYVGSVPYQESTLVIKELASYSIHQWIGSMQGTEYVKHASIVANTCASSIYGLYEAQRLLDAGVVEDVVIIAEERTSFNTIRVFKENRIPVQVSDGLAVVRLSNRPIGAQITSCKWAYEYNRNPFGVTASGYELVNTASDIVKVHGSGTVNNSNAEEVFADRQLVEYKSKIGHSQGASAAVELCMMLDDVHIGRILCVASGLGGWYGSCILHKTK